MPMASSSTASTPWSARQDPQATVARAHNMEEQTGFTLASKAKQSKANDTSYIMIEDGKAAASAFRVNKHLNNRTRVMEQTSKPAFEPKQDVLRFK
jgi:hypothetical protein